ncbi:sensor histidine kinase [Streptosporangium minutum]|uniref:sensor histidine kinase n=1 Tax=Streptosporangium minutum TaxID=569862 RepID=UPI001A993B98|nr:histidine kinase [Streptosporangium minutum]
MTWRVVWTVLVVAVIVSPASAVPAALPVALTAAAVIAAVLVRRRDPWVPPAAAAMSLVVDAVHGGPAPLSALWMPLEFAALLVLLYRSVRRSPPRHAALAGSALGVAIVMLPLRFTLWRVPQLAPEASVLACLTAFFPAVFVVGGALYLRLLEDRRNREVAVARRAQRLDVARDLHDFVAHEVTGIVLEAQAAQLGGSDAVLLKRIEEAGLRALESMDHMVGTLRDPDERGPSTRVYGLADLPDLVTRFAATGRVRADLDLQPELAASREAEGAIYLIVLEALTNVRRHAPDAARVTVEVRGGTTIGVTVVNDGGSGAPLAAARRGGGTGLAGLAERIAATGGSLSAGPYEKGWRVIAHISAER